LEIAIVLGQVSNLISQGPCLFRPTKLQDATPSSIDRNQTEDGFDQGAFSRSIRPEQPNHTGRKCQVDVAEHAVGPIAFVDPFHFKDGFEGLDGFAPFEIESVYSGWL
jgi:hypothetical protein